MDVAYMSGIMVLVSSCNLFPFKLMESRKTLLVVLQHKQDRVCVFI